MIRGFQYSLSLATLGGAALVAMSAMTWLHFQLNAENHEQRQRATIAEANLSAQIAAKSMYERENLEALRERVGQLKIRLGTDGTWERVVGQFGPGWNSQLGTKDERGIYSIQYGTLEMVSPSPSDWPRIVEAVKASEAIPGVGIAELEMRASGGLGKRTLDVVRILVAVQTRAADKFRTNSQ